MGCRARLVFGEPLTTCGSVTCPPRLLREIQRRPRACNADGDKSMAQTIRLNVTTSEVAAAVCGDTV
jgi:hypothetical protein